MRLPDDDGPRWLSDYGDIQADIDRMEQFAAKLAAEVRTNYATHLSQVIQAMSTTLVSHEEFPELHSFMQAHKEAQDQTYANVYTYRDATGGFANAAGQISAEYRGADAFSAARVSDVNQAIQENVATIVPTPVPSDVDDAPEVH